MSGPAVAWTSLGSGDEVAEAICALYRERGHGLYDEAVSQTAHGVQAARLAATDGAGRHLVVAALLHDIGHLLEGDPEHNGAHLDRDLRHEQVAARFLANWFAPEVTEPIRHHVAAKRWLVSAEPAYGESLSPASRRSLVLQGGTMTDAEARAFLATPGASEAVRVRRWDDLAKDPSAPAGSVDDFRDLIAAQCTARG